MEQHKASPAWMVPVVALFVAAFAVCTAENLIAGVLPALAADLQVDIPTAGSLITGYALGVALAGPLLALASSGVSRRLLLLAVMAIFIAGNVICALSDSYFMLLGARLLVACCQGLFFGVALVIAMRLAPEGRQTSAVSLVVAGGTAASVIGVPIGTAIGNDYGWRVAFWAIAAAGVLAAGILALLIPATPNQRQDRSQLVAEIRAAVRPLVLLCYAVIICFVTGALTLFAYIVPLLTEVSGVPPSLVPWVLFGMGLAGVFGNLIGGRLGDWNSNMTMIGILVVCLGLVFVMTQVVTSTWPMLAVLWTLWFVGLGFLAPVQGRILKEVKDAPNFASTLISTAFNIGIAGGAAAGGAAVAWGWGYASLPWIYFCSLCLALLGTLALSLFDRRAAVLAVAGGA